MLSATEIGVGIAEFPPAAELAPYDPELYEFVWILEGSGTWVSEGVRNELEPGQLLLLRPGMHGRFVWDAQRPTRHVWVEFRLTGAEALGPEAQWPIVRPLRDGGPLDALCRYVLWLSARADRLARDRLADVLAFTMIVWAQGPLPAAVDPWDDPVARAVAFARAAWAGGPLRALDLGELARAAAVSRGHLSRIFAERYGVGAVTAFERVRLARAAAMLLRTTMTVRSVSAACGFANPYHFSRRFRSLYGVPPRSYRAARGVDPDPLADTPLAVLVAATRGLL